MDADRLLSDPAYAAVLARVRAEPWEGTHRLVLADRLDELGEGAAAEFVRVQCEMARVFVSRPGHNGGTATGVRNPMADWREAVERLRRRQGEVLTPDREREWLGRGWPLWNVGGWDWSRGLLSQMSCPLAHWVRHGPALVRSPLACVTAVRVTDREPYYFQRVHYWSRDTWAGARDALPGELFLRLPDHGLSSDGRSMRGFESVEAARDALSAACLAHAWATDPAAVPAGV